MKPLWVGFGISTLMCAAEGLWHPFGVPTEALLRGGMINLVAFIVMTVVVSVQMGIRSHRQMVAKFPQAKRVRTNNSGYVGSGGDIPVPVVFDTGCAPDGGGDGGSAAC